MANAITLSRFPILLLILGMLLVEEGGWRLAAVPVMLMGLLLDTVDGYVARRYRATSLVGSVLDIAADRAYELVFWVTFAYLRLIPLLIPIIVILRTTLTDGLRGIGAREGTPPLEQIEKGVGRFLVQSPWMRTSYAVSKILAFCGLGLSLALRSFPGDTHLKSLAQDIGTISNVLAWIAVTLCIVRGLPVILHARFVAPSWFQSHGSED